MKKVPLILLCCLPYILLVQVVYNVFTYTEDNVEDPLITMPVMIVVCAIIILNIIYAIVMCRGPESAKTIAFWNLVVKVAHIPFYVIVFIIGILGALLGLIPVPFMFFIGITVVFFLFLGDFIVLFSTVSYGIAASLSGYKSGFLSQKEAVGYSVMHFFFCLDVIAAILMYFKIKKQSSQFTY